MMETIRRFKLLTAIFKGWLPRDLDGAVKRGAQAAMMMVQTPRMYVAFLLLTSKYSLALRRRRREGPSPKTRQGCRRSWGVLLGIKTSASGEAITPSTPRMSSKLGSTPWHYDVEEQWLGSTLRPPTCILPPTCYYYPLSP